MAKIQPQQVLNSLQELVRPASRLPPDFAVGVRHAADGSRDDYGSPDRLPAPDLQAVSRRPFTRDAPRARRGVHERARRLRLP